MAAVLMGGFRGVEEPKSTSVVVDPAGHAVQASNVKALGKLLYTEYLFPIEIAAVILLVAMLAAIALTLRQRKDSKAIDPSEQVHVRAADRLEVLKIAAIPRAAPASDVPVEEKKV
jgi:NADH-quinone oxidoreductase subunit J